MNRSRTNSQTARGFTLIEVLATLVLLAIVLPVSMRGVSVALSLAEKARHTSEAASLADAKLNELITTGGGTASAQGDFGADWPGYQWSSQTSTRDFGVSEVMLTVTWAERGQQRSLNVSTMVSDTTSTGNTGTIPLP